MLYGTWHRNPTRNPKPILKGGSRRAALAFVEELLPFTDAVPTATLAWCLEHRDLLPQGLMGYLATGAAQRR